MPCAREVGRFIDSRLEAATGGVVERLLGLLRGPANFLALLLLPLSSLGRVLEQKPFVLRRLLENETGNTRDIEQKWLQP